MRRKILFILPSFGIGGTTVSVKNLLLTLDSAQYDAYVMPLRGEGVLRDVFADVRLVDAPFVVTSLTDGDWQRRRSGWRRLELELLRLVVRCVPKMKSILLRNEAAGIMKKYGFDAVVACQEGKATFFGSCFCCRNRVAWVRCDYERRAAGLKSRYQEFDVYDTYDSIVCVSDLTAAHFVDIFPKLRGRTFAINNPQSGEYIVEQSSKDDCDQRFRKDGFTLLSIGRIDPVKRFTHIPEVAAGLLRRGVRFRWFVVGEGDEVEYNKIIAQIDKWSVQECVVCLGAKTNPHFYIANADVLVCLSSSEACPRVINEAKILHIPVICTDFPTASEFIESGENGIICPIDSIADNIYTLLTDDGLRRRIIAKIGDFEFDNGDILNQIDGILQK